MSIQSDSNRFINAIREVLGKGPLPFSVDVTEPADHLVPHMMRGMGDGCHRAHAHYGSADKLPRHRWWAGPVERYE